MTPRSRADVLAQMMELTRGVHNAQDRLRADRLIRNFILMETIPEDVENEREDVDLQDVVAFFEFSNKSNRLGLEKEIGAFREAVKEDNKEHDVIRMAAQCDKETKNGLQEYVRRYNGRVLFDKTLDVNGRKKRYDAIVVTGHFIMILKQYTPLHDVRISPNGILSWYNVCTGKIEIRDEFHMFVDWQNELDDLMLFAEIPVSTYYCTMAWKSDRIMVNADKRLISVQIKNDNSWIEELPCCKGTPEFDVDDVVRVIKRVEVEARPYWICSTMMQAYAELRSAWENAIADDR